MQGREKSNRKRLIVALIGCLCLWVGGAGLLYLKAAGKHGIGTAWPRTDFSRASVPLGEFRAGGPPKDGIPAIDQPKMVPLRAVDTWLNSSSPVIEIGTGREWRAYPLEILLWHEIVNDVIDGAPVAITYCPLCNAAICFDRRIDGMTMSFGTTGMVRKSDLVMYDRQSESWWQQFTGECVVGKYTGKELRIMSSRVVSYNDFKLMHPAGKIMSRETGFKRLYGQTPYSGYDDTGGRPFLFDEAIDERLAPLERVVGIEHGGRWRAYALKAVKESKIINDSVGGQPVAIVVTGQASSVLNAKKIAESKQVSLVSGFSRRVGGRELLLELRDGKIYDRETKSVWDLSGHGIAGKLKGTRLAPLKQLNSFAFSWFAFHPDSDLYHSSGSRYTTSQ